MLRFSASTTSCRGQHAPIFILAFTTKGGQHLPEWQFCLWFTFNQHDPEKSVLGGQLSPISPVYWYRNGSGLKWSGRGLLLYCLVYSLQSAFYVFIPSINPSSINVPFLATLARFWRESCNNSFRIIYFSPLWRRNGEITIHCIGI
jgi:hypothetical protein